MIKYYQNASGGLKRIEKSSDFEGPEGYKEVTETEYNRLYEELQKDRKTRVLLAMQEYRENQDAAAKVAYNELRALGLSDISAKAISKWTGEN